MNNIINNIKNNLYFMKYVINYSKSYVFSQAIISLLRGITPLLGVIFPKLIIDELIAGNNFSIVIKYIVLYVFFQLIFGIIDSLLSNKYVNLNGHLYSMHFLMLINKKIADLDMAQTDMPKTHQKIALAQDIIYKGIGIGLINSFFSAISSIITILTTATVIIMADKFLLPIILLFSIISVVLNVKAENWRMSQRDENVYLTRVLNYYIKIMGDKNNLKEMKMFGFAEWLMRKYMATIKDLKKRLAKLYEVSTKISIVGIVLENIKSNGIYIYLAWLTFEGKLTIGGFTQYFNATGQLSNSVIVLAGFFTQLNINGKYIQSFRDFMELDSKTEKEGGSSLSNEKKIEIRFENVSFRYPGADKYTLQNINYTFESDKSYAIIGENGAGKTTLINLMTRIYEPTDGTIYINGKPLNEVNIFEYRKLFSVVFQDFKYFAFTLAENVALDKYNNTKSINDKINQCLMTSGLKTKVDSLSKGIDTHLDKIFYDDGIQLSGGENQKLALARALFRNFSIIILDEPSSALDPLAEDELLNSFDKIKTGKMMIYISHRMSCATKADKIIFIKNNTIYETGTHDDLMKKGGDYSIFYNTQAKHYTSAVKENSIK